MLAGILARRRTDTKPSLLDAFERHKDRVFTTALACLNGDRAAAEDAAQEVFIRLAYHLPRFRGEARLTTYLHRITVNVCRDELRRRQRSHQPPSEAVSDDAFARNQQRRELHEALERLPETFRTPILLRFFQEMSYDEIANVLGCPAGTVATRLHRGLKLLAKRLGEES